MPRESLGAPEDLPKEAPCQLTFGDFRRAGGRKRGCLIWDARHFVRPAGREPPDSDPHRGGRGTDSVGLAPERAANPENCARSRNEVSGGTSRWPRKGLARVRPLSHAPTRLLSCPGRPDGAISTGTPADLESAVAPRPSHGARATPVANRPRDRSPRTRHRRAGDQRYHTLDSPPEVILGSLPPATDCVGCAIPAGRTHEASSPTAFAPT
jgi:hypothetical protein